ncbi:four helix bundle protein [Nafulsella turpanensis]|uniref:four helix bundle protein n=1 Tax=Nafulsella turpanensis TaxID=1265690 RepID=UPI00036C4E7D|nr:four helix bundle protein [Nafulsella turpanensis]
MESGRASENIILTKSYDFALRVVKAYRFLTEEQKEFVLSKQLLRSGTSIGANVEEAVAASSKADFIHKLNIAAKEARETSYWLRLLRDSQYFPDKAFSSIHNECLEIRKILSSILITLKSKT